MGSKAIVGVMPLYDDEKNSIWMLPQYMDALSSAGSIPVMLPLNLDETDAEKTDSLFDGYLFTGGHDIAPSLYGEEKSILCGAVNASRDKIEKMMFERAYAENKPVLGICRGIQIINALLGGTLYQDLPTERPTEIPHTMKSPYSSICHYVNINKESALYRLLKVERLGVNSYHHQAIKTLGNGLNAAAVADDGTVEAVECVNKDFICAVQWHPEYSYASDENSVKIFSAFAKACEKYRLTRRQKYIDII